jgi:hypothetical protein
MSVTARTPISRSKFAQIEDLDDLKEFYKLIKSGNFRGEIKCLHVPNARIKTIIQPEFAGPVNIESIDRLKYVTIKYYDDNDEEKRIKITVPEKNKPFINEYYYSKNTNGGSRKIKRKRTKQRKPLITRNKTKRFTPFYN